MVRCLGYKDNFVTPSKRHFSVLTLFDLCGNDNSMNSVSSILFSSSQMYRRNAFTFVNLKPTSGQNLYRKVMCATPVLKHGREL